jgi:hypothetical protein
MKRLLYILFCSVVVLDTFSQGCSPTISLIGSSLIESPPTFPTNRIGSDYADSDLIIGGTGNISLSIANAGACTNNWQISVSRTDITTNIGLSFWVKRTNDGIGSAGSSIDPMGLANFLKIETFSQNLFLGLKNRTSIQINYKISGISVVRNANTYRTTIYYTISGTI